MLRLVNVAYAKGRCITAGGMGNALTCQTDNTELPRAAAHNDVAIIQAEWLCNSPCGHEWWRHWAELYRSVVECP